MQIRYSRRADTDILEAWTYYEGEQNGLGFRFLDTLEEMLYKVKANPQHYSFIDQSESWRDVVLHPFPFRVVFEIYGDAILLPRF